MGNTAEVPDLGAPGPVPWGALRRPRPVLGLSRSRCWFQRFPTPTPFAPLTSKPSGYVCKGFGPGVSPVLAGRMSLRVGTVEVGALSAVGSVLGEGGELPCAPGAESCGGCTWRCSPASPVLPSLLHAGAVPWGCLPGSPNPPFPVSHPGTRRRLGAWDLSPRPAPWGPLSHLPLVRLLSASGLVSLVLPSRVPRVSAVPTPAAGLGGAWRGAHRVAASHRRFRSVLN